MSENNTDGYTDGTERETHIDDELGLFVPKDLREFDSQIVFRTPRATIQHFGSQPLDGYYGMIRADEFGDPDEMEDPKNPDLAPDRVKIKPQGKEPVTLTVETEPEIRTDGGHVEDGTERIDGVEIDHAVARTNREVRQRDECIHCGDEVPDEDFREKYAGAGGVLAGPFCCPVCYWGWMNA